MAWPKSLLSTGGGHIGRRRFAGSTASRAAIVLALAALTVSTTACGAASSTASAGTIRIGITDALSGPGAFYGIPQLGAWKVVANQYNSQGGVNVGGKKYKIKLFSADDQWDPTTVKNVVDQQILQDHVQVVVTSGDPQDPVVAPVTEANHVILEDRTANVDLVKKPNKYVWNSWSAAYVDTHAYYKALLKLHPSIKSVYGLGVDYQYDINNDAWDRSTVKSMGLKWLGQTFYPASTVDFSSILEPIVQAHPDLIALGSESTDTPAILKTLRQLGYTGYVGSDVPSEDLQRDIKGAGSAANNFYQVEAFTWPHTAQLTKFISQFEALGYQWDALAADQWIANELMIKAFQDAGTVTNTAKVMKALTTVSVRDWLVPGGPKISMGGLKTYGQVRELDFPLALNQDVNGSPKTQAVLHFSIP